MIYAISTLTGAVSLYQWFTYTLVKQAVGSR